MYKQSTTMNINLFTYALIIYNKRLVEMSYVFIVDEKNIGGENFSIFGIFLGQYLGTIYMYLRITCNTFYTYHVCFYHFDDNCSINA